MKDIRNTDFTVYGRGVNPSPGDKVLLISETFSRDYAYSESNPHVMSPFACFGRVDTIRGTTVYVSWDNGHANTYSKSDLGFVSSQEEETMSMFILNSDIEAGGIIIKKKGSRMFSRGDYVHDKDGEFFIRVDSDLLKKKRLFTKKEL